MSRSVNVQKIKSEEVILEVLMNAPQRGVRWTDLVEKTKLSKRTLRKRLVDLAKRGIIGKYIDTETGKYPPPVIYFLAERAFTNEVMYPLYFSIDAFWNLSSAMMEAAETAEVFNVFGRKAAALASFTVIEAMLAKSKNEAEQWLNLLNYEVKKELFRELAKRMIYESGKKMTVGESVDIGRLVELIPKNRLDELKTVLKQIYPEEVKLFDWIKRVAAANVEIREALKRGEISEEIQNVSYVDAIKAWMAWKEGRLGPGPFELSTVEEYNKLQKREEL